MSIRRFRTDKLGADDLVGRESWTTPMKDFLDAAVACRLNVVVSGGTGSGKTTLLNILSGFIGEHERVVTIEDAAELKLRQRHVVRLETRPANIEGKGAVRQRDLVVNALRMRPDRIVIGEVRSEEALDMLQAMNTGHDGSLTTIHANSPRDALYRLDTMVAMANLNIPEKAIRQQIASAVNLIVQASRMSDGTRKVTAISELTGMEGEVITMQDIFTFERMGITQDGTGAGTVPCDRNPAEVRGAAGGLRRPAPDGHVRARQGHRLSEGITMAIVVSDISADSGHRPRRVLRVRACAPRRGDAVQAARPAGQDGDQERPAEGGRLERAHRPAEQRARGPACSRAPGGCRGRSSDSSRSPA